MTQLRHAVWLGRVTYTTAELLETLRSVRVGSRVEIAMEGIRLGLVNALLQVSAEISRAP